MRFTEAGLPGAYIVDLEPRMDERGFFSRAYCPQEFEALGLKPLVAQSNLSFNHVKGTVRGLHYQVPPAAEAKLIRCIRGAIYEVIVDMRPDSPTHLRHIGVELSAHNRRALYIPEMFAAGYQALTDEAETFYQVSGFYAPECERGLRYDDPALAVAWPLPVTRVSEKDAACPLLSPATIGGRV